MTDIATQLEDAAHAFARGDDASLDLITNAVRELREAVETNTRLSGRHSITLNQYQLLRAVEQCGGIFTGSDLTIEYFDEHECDEDGEKVKRPSGLYLYWTEYPEEGSTPLDDGPLTETFECIVCHVCGNERTIANGATGTDPRGYSNCTNCSDHKGPLSTAK